MSVITWRNVNQPTGASEAAALMQGASRSITSGLDSFNNILKQREATQADNMGVENNIQKQDFLDILAGARTPEELAALAPQIEAARSGMNATNRGATRDAEAVRSGALMQQITAKSAFEDQRIDREQAPIRDQIMGMVANGDSTGALAALTQNPNLRNSAAVYQAVKTGERDLTKFGWEKDKQERDATRFGWDTQEAAAREALRPLDLASRKASLEATQEQTANSREDRALLVQQRAAATASAQAQAQSQLLRDGGNVYADGIFTPDKSQELMELMTKLEIGDDVGERQAVIKRLTAAADQELEYWDEATKSTKKISVPIPMSLAKQAILGSKDQVFDGIIPNGWNQGHANSMEQNLRSAMRQNIEMNDASGKPMGQNKAVLDYQQYLDNAVNRAKNPAPAAGKKPR